MSEQPGDLRRDLLYRIDGRRASIDEYLQRARPRGGRLVTVAIVSSALSAVFTAGPALGGEPFAESVATTLALPNDSVVWRSLCFLALGVSLVAAITTNLARSQDTERKIAAAESANAELEGLRTLVAFGQVSVGDAATQYQQAVAKIPWVDEHHAAPAYDPVGAPYPGPPPAWGLPGPPPQGRFRPGRPVRGSDPRGRGPQDRGDTGPVV